MPLPVRIGSILRATCDIAHRACCRTQNSRRCASQWRKGGGEFSDPGMVTFFRDNMNQMIDGGVDLVFCNEIEALGWAETENLDEAASKLKGIAKSFVITRGGDGAILFDGETTHEIAAQKVEAVNTNGAGDMFAGAFSTLWRGSDMRGACEFASKAAAAVVCQPGPRLSLSDSQELKNSHFEA